jgi:phosphoribosylformylglycinamidine cyclo-ligase
MRLGFLSADLVAMSVNDVLLQGAEPLFFLDYFACGKLGVDVAAAVVGGMARGCELFGCALIGGETAEMLGMDPAGEYDLAGFAVGAVEKSKIRTGRDVVLGLASSGVHSNGFSLVRKCIDRAASSLPTTLDGQPFKQALTAPTRLYVKSVLGALAVHPIKALAHITGGGLLENIPRMLPEGLAEHLVKGSWPQTELFAWLQATAGIGDHEMNRTFNNGIGMVVVEYAAHAQATPTACVKLASRCLRSAALRLRAKARRSRCVERLVAGGGVIVELHHQTRRSSHHRPFFSRRAFCSTYHAL